MEPIYDYLDEALDTRALILSLLILYKKRSECFKRKSLYDLWEGDTRRGEKLLALDLYEYLFDQGVSFHIEPWSVAGEADIVSSQTGEERLLADVKIFNPERDMGKVYLVKGFHQIYTYTQDFNEPFGFLIIFKTSRESVNFSLSQNTNSCPFVTHNGKTIFFLVVDLYPWEESASKRGQLQSIEITDSHLVGTLSAKQEHDENNLGPAASMQTSTGETGR